MTPELVSYAFANAAALGEVKKKPPKSSTRSIPQWLATSVQKVDWMLAQNGRFPVSRIRVRVTNSSARWMPSIASIHRLSSEA